MDDDVEAAATDAASADAQTRPDMTPEERQAHERARRREQARMRLETELANLPTWGTVILERRLLAVEPPETISYGAVVHFIRYAHDHPGRAATIQTAEVQRPAHAHRPTSAELFVVLMQRLESSNRQWARERLARVPGMRSYALSGPHSPQDDLLGDLHLALWREIATQSDDAWELFFRQSLRYLRLDVMDAYLKVRGYQITGGNKQATQRTRRMELLLTEMAAAGSADDTSDAGKLDALIALSSDAMEPFSASELVDLKAAVRDLPMQERATIFMRFWQDETLETISKSLGMKDGNSARYLLKKVLVLLRKRYEPTDGEEHHE